MIKLKNILEHHFCINNKDNDEPNEWITRAMKEACDKTIDLCIESIVDEEDKELQQCVESIRENLLSLKREIT